MAKNISMDEIAKLFNVSKVTISKALNDKPGVSESLREEIKKKAEELGYRFNSAARSLKTNKSYNIGILIPEKYVKGEGSYYFGVCGKLTGRLSELGYSSVMETISSKKEEELKLPRMYCDNKVDGIIVLGELSQEYLLQFEKFDIPVVFFDFYLNDSTIDSIVLDNYYAGFEITKLLIENGHREIGFLGNIYSTSSIKDRFLGYFRALLEYGIPYNEKYIISDRDKDGTLKHVQNPESLATAYVCNNDQGAYYFIKTLEENGIKVPDDVSIVSFDNTLYSSLSYPKITSYDNNVDEMVSVACKVILKKITVKEKKYDRILVKGFIVNRDTVKKI